MSTIEFDPVIFRQQVPAYSNPVDYPDATLQAFWDAAVYYVSNENYGCLQGDRRRYALNLMTAHLVYISDMATSGQVPYVLSASTIDKVQVSTVQVPLKNQWGWWLSTSPYGSQLWALLQVNSVGGFYAGGIPVLPAYRGRRGYGYAVKNTN
jgi:hypothetical protein